MSLLGVILLVVVILLLLGAFPAWPHSRNWGYGPSGGLGLLLVHRTRARVDWNILIGQRHFRRS